MLSRRNDHGASSFYGAAPAADLEAIVHQRPAVGMAEGTRVSSTSRREGVTAHKDSKEIRQDKLLRCAERQTQLLRRELCELRHKVSLAKPSIDPECLKHTEMVINLILASIRKAAEGNEIGAVRLIPEILAILDLVDPPFESLNQQKLKMQTLLSDARMTASAFAHLSCRIEGGQFPTMFQMRLEQEFKTLECPADLKYLAYATGDRDWLDLQTWWIRAPLSLRWLTVATQRKVWLAYVDLFMRSPEDLRWAAICNDDPRWLHFCAKWRLIDIDLKLRALKCQDLNFLRGSDFEGPRFELWDCETSDEMYLVPTLLKGRVCSQLLNRCINCPIHCRHGPDDRLDLQELQKTLLLIEELLAKDRADRSLRQAEEAKRVTEAEMIWQEKLRRCDSERERLFRELESLRREMTLKEQQAKAALAREEETHAAERAALKREAAEMLRQQKLEQEELAFKQQRERDAKEDQLDKELRKFAAKQNQLEQTNLALERKLGQLEEDLAAANANLEKEQRANREATLKHIEQMRPPTPVPSKEVTQTKEAMKAPPPSAAPRKETPKPKELVKPKEIAKPKQIQEAKEVVKTKELTKPKEPLKAKESTKSKEDDAPKEVKVEMKTKEITKPKAAEGKGPPKVGESKAPVKPLVAKVPPKNLLSASKSSGLKVGPNDELRGRATVEQMQSVAVGASQKLIGR